MNKPAYIGKYYSLNNARRIHRTIVQSQLYFTDPSNFNDPFEMNPALYRPKVFKPVRPHARKITPEAMKNIFEKLWTEQQEKLKKFGVCCFAETLDDIAMWSHYADNHRGLCLIFSTRYKFFNGLRQVLYVSKRLQMPLLEKKNPARLIELMISKLDLWSEEKEWRLFRRFRNRTYKYPKSALKGIIFGCRCAPEDRDLVLRLAQNRKVEFYEARMSQYEYKLDIVEIQP